MRLFPNKFNVDFTNDKSLASRFILASGWILGEHGLSQFLRFIGNLVLTRLLAPEMFGVMAVAHVFISGMIMFSDVGLNLNIIRSKRGDEASFLNTAWTLQVLRGTFLFAVSISLACLISVLSSTDLWRSESVYRNLDLPWVIGLLSLSPLIDGFKSTKVATANRNLDMGAVAFIQVGSQAAGTALMIFLALANPSIYALVFGGIFSRCVFVFSSHYFLSGRGNRFTWDEESVKEIFTFGKWIFLTSILGFLLASGDKLLLGGLTDPVNLGLYSLAMALISILVGISNKIVGKIGYAAISEIGRESPDRIKEIYYRIRFPLDGGLLLLAGILFMIGSSVLEWLYDDRYQYAGHIIEVLSLSLIFNRYNLFSKVMSALGRPELNVGINVIGIVSLYAGLPLVFNVYGFEGALWYIAGYKVFTLPLIFHLKNKFHLCDYKQELKGFLFLALGILIGALCNVTYSTLFN